MNKNTASFWPLFVCVCSFFTSPFSYASDVDFTYGGGTDNYESYDFRAALDIPKTPLLLNLHYNHIRSSGTELLTENGGGLTWNITDWASASIKYTKISQALFDVTGFEYGGTVFLNDLWNSDLDTRLDLGFGDYEYEPHARPQVLALLAGRVPDQRRYSVGLSQGITDNWYVFGNYDVYEYSTNPTFIASLLLLTFRQQTNATLTLLSFPDFTYGLGIGWRPNDKTNVSFSYSDTDAVNGQRFDSQRLSFSYRFNDKWAVNSALSFSNSESVIRNGRITIQGSDSTLVELGLSYSF